MSKKFLTIAFVIGTILVSQAQTIIPKAGFVLSSTNAAFSSDEYGWDTDFSSGTGFSFGVGYSIPVGLIGSGAFSVQPEFTFIQKGFKTALSGEINIGEPYYDFILSQHIKLNYLEVPVLAKIEFGTPTAKFSFIAGPSFGYALGGKTKGTLTLDDGYETYKEKANGKIKFGDQPDDEYFTNDIYIDNRTDIGLQVGAGVTLHNKVVFEVRYGLGFTNLSDDDDSANRAVQFTVGVPLTLK